MWISFERGMGVALLKHDQFRLGAQEVGGAGIEKDGTAVRKLSAQNIWCCC